MILRSKQKLSHIVFSFYAPLSRAGDREEPLGGAVPRGQPGCCLCRVCALAAGLDSRNGDRQTSVFVSFSSLCAFSAGRSRWSKEEFFFEIHLLPLFFLLGMDDGMFSSFIMIKNLLLFCISMNLASHFG